MRAPLEGIRVLDFTHSWAAPHSTRLLADFGAEVIRVEYPRRLCMVRGGRLDGQMYNKHPMWFQVNRGKLSVTLDLHVKADREILRDLVRLSDIVVENTRGGVLERFGLGYEDLRRIRPDVILLSMAAFGKTGAYAGRAGYGGTLEVLSGAQSLTGHAGEDRPSRIKELDTSNGVAGACAAITALFFRQRTGRGQWIDLSQLETAMHTMIGEHLLEFLMNGRQQRPMGNRHPRHAPQGCYRCAGEDRWVTICVRSEQEWADLCEALGHPEWRSDPKFSTLAARREHHDLLDQMIESWTAPRDAEEAMVFLQERGVAAGAVRDVGDVAKDEHLRERGFFIPVPGSEVPFANVPIRFSGGGAQIRWRGPDLGQHNDQVLRGLRGRADEPVRVVKEEELGTAFDPD